MPDITKEAVEAIGYKQSPDHGPQFWTHDENAVIVRFEPGHNPRVTIEGINQMDRVECYGVKTMEHLKTLLGLLHGKY